MLNLKLFRKENNLTQVQLAEYFEVTQAYISQIERGLLELPDEYISKIIADKSFKIPEQSISQAGNDMKTYEVPLLPISAQGGSLNDFNTSVNSVDCEKIISPIKNASFAITITGDSMAPEYPCGSQVLIKKIDEKAFIEWGKVYVLDTCNGIVIKRLIPSDKDGFIKCISDNDQSIYAPFDISLDNTYGIYRVMLCMALK